MRAAACSSPVPRVDIIHHDSGAPQLQDLHPFVDQVCFSSYQRKFIACMRKRVESKEFVAELYFKSLNRMLYKTVAEKECFSDIKVSKQSRRVLAKV